MLRIVLWKEFTSESQDDRRQVETEFEWMRVYAFVYFLSFFSRTASAEDFAQDVLERFIRQLQLKEELNRSYFMQLVRYCFLDQTRRSRRNALELSERGPKCEPGKEPLNLIEGVIDPYRGLDQDSALFRQEILTVLKLSLSAFSEEHQKVIKLRILGLSAQWIRDELLKEDIDISTNHINVIFYKFKPRFKEICKEKSISPR
jgi:DNA-directed RNA polymerase specialized sigma24 family protein